MKLNHTVEIVVRDNCGQPVRRWQLLYISLAAFALAIAVGLVIREIVQSLDYWLFEYRINPAWAFAWVPVGYAPG